MIVFDFSGACLSSKSRSTLLYTSVALNVRVDLQKAGSMG